MIVTKCPVRIGLVGGSSDLDSYMHQHGRGAVVSFPINIYTYITTHTDIIGYNSYHKKYIVNYSSKEETNTIEEIKNDVVRTAFKKFDVDPCLVSMTSDVFSAGSGLASSSSYMLSILKSISMVKNLNLSNFELSKLAMKLEREFNPLLGYQDTYGCGIGGLKKMDFALDATPKVTYLSNSIFNSFEMYLVYTGVSRSSTDILKTIKVTKDDSLLSLVDEMQDCIESEDREKFIELVSLGWKIKKKTSNKITSNKKIQELDKLLEQDDSILCHKLCGAGNGGFFLVITEPNTKSLKNDFFCRRIEIDQTGVDGYRL